MSIGWSDINPVLAEVFRDAAVDLTRAAGNFKAEWTDRPVRFIDPQQRLALRLRVTTVSEIGEDETRYSEDLSEGEDFVATQTGQRKFTLQAQAIVPENTDTQWAIGVLERARTRLGMPRVLDRLLELDVSVISRGPSINVPFKDDKRVFSSGTIDIVFGCTASEDDPVPVNWIQYLVISSHLSDGATQLPASQQMVNVEVPTIPTT